MFGHVLLRIVVRCTVQVQYCVGCRHVSMWHVRNVGSYSDRIPTPLQAISLIGISPTSPTVPLTSSEAYIRAGTAELFPLTPAIAEKKSNLVPDDLISMM